MHPGQAAGGNTHGAKQRDPGAVARTGDHAHLTCTVMTGGAVTHAFLVARVLNAMSAFRLPPRRTTRRNTQVPRAHPRRQLINTDGKDTPLQPVIRRGLAVADHFPSPVFP